MRRCITAIFGILALVGAGCSIMPTTGPEIGEIYRGGDTDDPTRLPYALVKITPQVIDTLASYAPRIGTVFPDRRPPREITFGIGDSVSVSLFEAAAPPPPPSCSTGKSWLHFRPPPVDFCSSRLA